MADEQTKADGVPTAVAGDATAGMASTPQAASVSVTPVERQTTGVTTESKQVSESDLNAWRAKSDKAQSQLRQQAEAARREAAEAAQQAREAHALLEQQRLAAADPEQRAAYFEQKLKDVEARTQADARVAAERQEFTKTAFDLITAAGFDPNSEEIAPLLTGGPSTAGLVQLTQGLVGLQGKRYAALEGRIVAEKRKTELETLASHGVGASSAATGAGSANETTRAQRELDEFAAKQRGAGRNGWEAVQKKRKELGL